jgi:hypothetical protein
MSATGEIVIAGYVGSNAKVARWDGMTWVFLGEGLYHEAQPLPTLFGLDVASNGDVYVGGLFTHADNGNGSLPVETGNIARWNDSAGEWVAVGMGTSSTVFALRVDQTGGLVYTSTQSGFNPDNTEIILSNIGRWNVTSSQWEPVGNGVDAPVQRIATSPSGEVFVAGAFVNAFNPGGGAVVVNYVARWDGSSWTPLGQGLDLDPFLNTGGLQVDGGGLLYLAGYGFTAVNGDGSMVDGPVVSWDGVMWSRLALSGYVGGGIGAGPSLVVDGFDRPYVFYFDTDSFIARWDGMQWTNIASFSPGEGAYTLASHAAQGDDVFAGGNFTQILDPGSPTVYSVRKNALWNGVAWIELLGSGGANGTVHAIAVGQPPDQLYIGGSFSEVALAVANNIASYDGVTWNSVANGVNGTVLGLAVNRDALAPWAVLGGEFTEAFDTDSNVVPANHVVLWNGTWVPLGNGVDGSVRAVLPKIAYFNGSYYGGIVVAGSFSTAFNSDGSSIVANSIAWFDWETQRWEPFGNGITGGGQEVWAITEGTSYYYPVSQPNFYLGGSFTGGLNSNGSTVSSNNIIYWNNDIDEWESVGQGVNGLVRTLALSFLSGVPVEQSLIYVGGDFLQSTNGNGSTVSTPHLAVWDQFGDQWIAVEGGVDGPVHTISRDGVIGGEFTHGLYAGGTTLTMNRVGMFSLTEVPTWFALGPTGADDIVRTMESVPPCIGAGQIIYSGGDFVQIGHAVLANGLARWHHVYQPCYKGASSVYRGSGTGFRGVASGPDCSPISTRVSARELTLFDSLDFRGIAPIDSLFFHKYFDLTLYPVNDPNNPLISFDSLFITSDDAGMLTFVGVDDTSLYAPNPEGRSTAVSVVMMRFETEGLQPGEVQLLFINGVTDAPTVDIVIQGGVIVVESLPYGEAAAQVALVPGSYTFDVVRHDGGEVLGTYMIDLSSYADQVVTMLLSGFLDPSANQNGPAMSLEVLETGVQVVDVEPATETGNLPERTSLGQNYPNPFNPKTTIVYEVHSRQSVRLSVYDLLGREVATLVNETKAPGTYEVSWDATGQSSGIYFYRLIAGSFVETKKLVLVR